ncbi:cation acetate symporter [Streptomyces macrosporus]|uniref:Cation acetate symporter n=1 Tax=Streptomyces macrosporus TaxID=44032 RepID=A0ABP5XBH7_9ACTN
MTGGRQALALLPFRAAVAAVVSTRRAGRGRRASPEEFHTGGRLSSPVENGFVLAGDHLPVAALLGVAGLIALHGHGAPAHSVGFLAAWPVVLLVAESVRNCGRFTLADVVAARLRERSLRIAVGISSVTVSVLHLAAQTVAACGLVALLPGGTGVRACVVGVGALAAVLVARGGMRATTRAQAVAAVLLLAGFGTLTVLVLLRHGGDPGALVTAAAERGGHGSAIPVPGPAGGLEPIARTDLLALGVALVLGAAGLPHLLARFVTVPTARAARRSVVWATGLSGALHLAAVVLGLGAAALVGPDAVRALGDSGNAAVPLLALDLGGGAGSTGGAVLCAVVVALAFAAVLATVAGVTLVCSTAVAHDLAHDPYASFPRRRRRGRRPRSARNEVAVARAAVPVVGAFAVALGLLARETNPVFLVGLAFAVAASAHLPVLLYALFWRRFTARGALWAVYGGLVAAVVPTVLSPLVSGGPQALLPQWDFAVLPLRNPGPVSVPLGFLAGWLGTLLSPKPPDGVRYAETEVRALTGAGAA